MVLSDQKSTGDFQAKRHQRDPISDVLAPPRLTTAFALALLRLQPKFRLLETTQKARRALEQ